MHCKYSALFIKRGFVFKAQILKNRSGFVMKSKWGERCWWQTHDYQNTIPSTYRKGQWMGWGLLKFVTQSGESIGPPKVLMILPPKSHLKVTLLYCMVSCCEQIVLYIEYCREVRPWHQ